MHAVVLVHGNEGVGDALAKVELPRQVRAFLHRRLTDGRAHAKLQEQS